MLRHCIGLIGLTALIIPSATAQRRAAGAAQGQNSTWTLLVGKYDKNKDGKISADEYNRGDDKFSRFDSNSDGVLTAEDFSGRGGRRGGGRRMRQRMSPEQMASMTLKSLMASNVDTDKDGKVTQKEWKTFLKSIANPEGIIDVSQLRSNQATARQNRGGRGNRGGGNRGGGNRGGGNRGGGNRGSGVQSATFDKNQDGEVTIAELSPWFAKLDGNKDGVLAGAELRSNRGGRRSFSNLPSKGDVAPDFILPYVSDAQKKVQLSSFAGKKPVALIFGSYT